MNKMISLQAPSSKSLSHRTLIGAALADGTSLVHKLLHSEDIDHTRTILAAAGARFEDLPDGVLRVHGVSGKLAGAVPNAGSGRREALSCNVHESGTTCRLLTAVLAAGQGRFCLHGAPRMHQRPISTLVAALQSLGATISYEEQGGCPPIVIEANGLRGGMVSVALDESSQYLSGLLMAAPLCREPLIIKIGGTKSVSWPYIGLTLQVLDNFGIPFEAWGDEKGRHKIDWRAKRKARPGRPHFAMRPASYRSGNFIVEGDWSGASYFLAAGAVGKRPVRVTNLRSNSMQGDRFMLEILRSMGARVEEEADQITVYPSELRGIEIDMGACPDLVPTLAALAAFATGDTLVSNVPHLRIKECDRIQASVVSLRTCGIEAEERSDGLLVRGAVPRAAACFDSFGDHRIAMAAAVLGIRHGPIRVDKAEVVRKSFPTFWECWAKVLNIS